MELTILLITFHNCRAISRSLAHSDEQVYNRYHIIWKEPQLYKNRVSMEGFHQLCVGTKTIFKRHSIEDYQKWLIG